MALVEVDSGTARWLEEEVVAQRDATIYTLADPRDGKVRYVGVTLTPRKRLRQHLTTTMALASPLGAWLRELRDAHKQPLMEVVAVVPEKERWKAERRLITTMKEEGVDLLNQEVGTTVTAISANVLEALRIRIRATHGGNLNGHLKAAVDEAVQAWLDKPPESKEVARYHEPEMPPHWNRGLTIHAPAPT